MGDDRLDPAAVLAGARGLLFDIEGTTTPISFVHDVLFPDARAQLASACAQAAQDEDLSAAVRQLEQEHRAEGARIPFGDGSAYAASLMDEDRKSTGLKALQGILWQRGYEEGRLQGQLFDDAAPALRAFHEAGLSLRIFSSGSIRAQKLLFGHSEDGDLLPLLDGHFDTTTGSKKEADSYRTIAREWGLAPDTLVFFSDIVAELDAAREAGLRTVLMLRPGNAALGVDGSNGHPAADDGFGPFVSALSET